MTGCLHVVATPIGNLDDLSDRARKVLANCDLVVAEDTRHSGRLLARLGIDRPLRSLHEHSDAAVVAGLIERLQGGDDLALVSDAGTPLISDPGFELVRAARVAGLRVLPVPGACAAIAALSVSGLPSDRFQVCGFPPAKPGPRRQWLEALSDQAHTLVLYESSHRVTACVADLIEVFGADRPVFLAREMTKLHEQHWSGELEALSESLARGEIPLKGEFVLVLGGARQAASGAEQEARRLLSLLSGQMSPSHAARVVAAFSGLPRNRCYELAQDLKIDGD